MPPCKSYTAVHLFFSVLVFNLQPHPPGMDPGTDAMEWNSTLQGIYGPSMKALW